MKFYYLIGALGVWVLAAIHYYWIAPQLLRLPADYAEETSFAATTSSRARPNDAFQTSNLIARRVDQTLVNSAVHSIIQGDIHWMNNGAVEFEAAGVYGVNRHTRENIPGFGDNARTGFFLFPLHLERENFLFWDPMYVGSRQATFERTDVVDGLSVYVFRFIVTNLDETAGYNHLPDVPERYRANSDAEGFLWIEPTSGILVDFSDQGASYLIDIATGNRVGDFYRWVSQYTPQTKEFKVKQAKAERLRITILQVWLPLVIAIVGLALFVIGLRKTTMEHPLRSTAAVSDI